MTEVDIGSPWRSLGSDVDIRQAKTVPPTGPDWIGYARYAADFAYTWGLI
jgi:hypothetical protein